MIKKIITFFLPQLIQHLQREGYTIEKKEYLNSNNIYCAECNKKIASLRYRKYCSRECRYKASKVRNREYYHKYKDL